MNLKQTVLKLLALVFVPKCIACNNTLPIGSDAMCDSCRAEYENSKLRQCGVCGLEFPRCRCVYKEYDVRRVKKYIKLFKYDPKRDESAENKLIYALKSHDNSALHSFLARELAERLKDVVDGAENEWSVTYPPRSRAGIRKYGFDHMEELAACLADELSLECYRYIKRSRGSKAQKKLDRRSREENAKQSYKECGIDLSGKRIILVDDVVTSGSTMKSITKLLFKMGAAEIVWASLGVTKIFYKKYNYYKFPI